VPSASSGQHCPGTNLLPWDIFHWRAFTHIGGSTDVSITGIVHVVADNILRVEKNKEPLYTK